MDTHEVREREFSRLIAVELVKAGKDAGVRQFQIARATGVTAEQFSAQANGRKGLLTVGQLLHGAERIGIDPQVIVQRAYALLAPAADVSGGAVVRHVIAPDRPEGPEPQTALPAPRRGALGEAGGHR